MMGAALQHNIKLLQYEDWFYCCVIQGLCSCMQQRYGTSRTAPCRAIEHNWSESAVPPQGP